MIMYMCCFHCSEAIYSECMMFKFMFMLRNTLRHFSIARARSTRIVGQPTNKSFELRINTWKDLSIQLIGENTTSH